MSIVGEMWEEKYDKLERSIPKKMEKFATWIAEEGYRPIRYNLWARKYGLELYGTQADVYYNTEQLVSKFLKDSK